MADFDMSGFQSVHLKEENMLHERRVFLNLTQQQVADRAGIPLQSYQAFESGKRNIMSASFRIACKVLEALEMDIVSFFHGDYTFGEQVYLEKDGLHFTKNGRSVSDDPDSNK